MIDHTGITVSDFARSLAFYEAALAPRGVARSSDCRTLNV